MLHVNVSPPLFVHEMSLSIICPKYVQFLTILSPIPVLFSFLSWFCPLNPRFDLFKSNFCLQSLLEFQQLSNFGPLPPEKSDKIIKDNFWTLLGNVYFHVNCLATLQWDRYWTNLGNQSWTFIGHKCAMAHGSWPIHNPLKDQCDEDKIGTNMRSG